MKRSNHDPLGPLAEILRARQRALQERLGIIQPPANDDPAVTDDEAERNAFDGKRGSER